MTDDSYLELAPTDDRDDACAPRAAYRAPRLRVIGDARELTQRNLFAPGNQDGSVRWRRTG